MRIIVCPAACHIKNWPAPGFLLLAVLRAGIKNDHSLVKGYKQIVMEQV